MSGRVSVGTLSQYSQAALTGLQTDGWVMHSLLFQVAELLSWILKLPKAAWQTFQDYTDSSHCPHKILHTPLSGTSVALDHPTPFCFSKPCHARAFSNTGTSPRQKSFLKYFVLLPSCFSPIPFSTTKHLHCRGLITELTSNSYRAPTRSRDRGGPSSVPHFPCWVQNLSFILDCGRLSKLLIFEKVTFTTW